MQPTHSTLLAAALIALATLGGRASASAAGWGPVVRCEPCDAQALAQCAPPPAGPECVELVREPGCGCCLTCALREGQACGVYTERCGAGLRCQPQPGEPRPLRALLKGLGLCTNGTAAELLRAPLRPSLPAPANGSESEEDPGAGTTDSPALPDTHRVPDSVLHPGPIKMDTIKKGQNRDSQRYKVDYEAQTTDTQNFSTESKLETEYGPCRREMEETLSLLKFQNSLSPGGVHIPNCDKKGFYKRKQCRPSKGRKRGTCWCVDRYGQPLPGYNTSNKGDLQCDNAESQ
ncbi:insulin-like growth factor-binding protein 3 [Saccopteryx leptura]|uniref:insulin-like growth factor-binding protein 3 n=1 Tax=Saccopteryx leptura TaxID=249018 RepID=UPI00339CB0FA